MSNTTAKKPLNRNALMPLSNKRTIREIIDEVYADIAAGDAANATVISGTFTPTLQDSSESDAEGQTYNAGNTNGYYRKIGDMVEVWVSLSMSSIGTLTGTDQCLITGLPFTALRNAPGTCGYATGLAITAGVSPVPMVFAGDDIIKMYQMDATTGHSLFTIDDLSADGFIILHLSYIASS